MKSSTSYLDWYCGTIPKSWTIPDHVRLIAEHLDAIDRGEIDRLAISMPPRHGKSETITVRYPVKCFEDRPIDNVLVTGYNQRFAQKFGRRSRNIAAERGMVADDKSASDEWVSKSGAIYMARGVGSPPTGTGFSRIIIDDPIKRREEAASELYREKMWDWYSEDLYSRLEPSGAIIMVATRWHEDDIIARAIASEPGKWTVLNLPAISDDSKALWPARYDLEALERIRAINAYSFEALYQGNPTPREGSFFKVSQLKIIDDCPRLLRQCRAWDIGASADGDPTAGVKMGIDQEGRFIITDVVCGQWPTDERNQRIKRTAEIDGVEVSIRGPQDPGAAGKDAALYFTRMLPGYKVKTLPVSGDKQTRADPFSSQVNAGNVYLLRGIWNAGFIEELRQFPGGKHDDRVDASADAFSELTHKRVAQPMPVKKGTWV